MSKPMAFDYLYSANPPFPFPSIDVFSVSKTSVLPPLSDPHFKYYSEPRRQASVERHQCRVLDGTSPSTGQPKPVRLGSPASAALPCDTLMPWSPNLEAALALGLLVDVSETSLLFPLLKQAGGGEEERRINTGHTKCGCENIINENVGETGNGRSAASHQSGGGG